MSGQAAVRRSIVLSTLLVCASVLLGWSSPAFAVAYVDDSVVTSGDGLSWATAKKTIAEGILAAAPAGEVWVAEGTYTAPIVMPGGFALYGGFAGTETNPTQRDVEKHPTVVDVSTANGGNPAMHALTFAATANMRVDGLVFRGGQATGQGDAGNGGGAFCRNLDATVVIAQCTFRDNMAGGGYNSGLGGAVFVTGGAPVFEDCQFVANSASDTGGGAFLSDTEATFTRCTFSGNSAYSGGGIRAEGSDSVIDGCRFRGNTATFSGGGFFFRYGTAAIRGCEFTSNAGGEGAAFMLFSGAWNVSDCTIVGNQTSIIGGGVGCYGSSLTLDRCLIVGNATVQKGGGIECHEGSTASLRNTVISGNWSDDMAGGIFCGLQSMDLINCTIADNAAGSKGGGVYMERVYWKADRAGLSVVNSLFSGNGAYAVYEDRASAVDALTNCLFYDNPNGDVYDSDSLAGFTGAPSIELYLPEAAGTVDGNPAFMAGPSGKWLQAPIYDGNRDRTYLIAAEDSFTPGQLEGLVLNPNLEQVLQTVITANDTYSLEVMGNVTGLASAGDDFRVLDYHIGHKSAAIDATSILRTKLAVADIDGETRPFDIPGRGSDGVGQGWDIGADEFVDTDGDWFSDVYEARYGETGGDLDTDGDLWTDAEEIDLDSDPADRASVPYPKGDANLSGQTDAVDVQLVVNAVLGLPVTGRTDWNLSGTTDAVDVQFVVNAVLGVS